MFPGCSVRKDKGGAEPADGGVLQTVPTPWGKGGVLEDSQLHDML